MSYFLNSSNLFSIQSAIEEFKRVILAQNQVIGNLQTALNTSLSRVDALETTTAANTTAITANTTSITANTTATTSNTNAIAGQASSIASNTTALNASLSRVDALELTTSSNTSAIAGQASSIASNTTNITTVLDELAATNRTVTANTTVLSTIATNVGNLQPVVASHTTSLAALQTQVTTNTSDLATKTTQISVLDSISAGHTTSIGNNYNEIFRLNGVSLNHATLLTGLRTDVDSGSGSQADIATLQSEVATINSTLATNTVLITENRILFTGFGDGISSIVGRLNAAEADLSTVNTTLAAHDVRISYNLSVFTGFLGASQSLVTRLDTVEADISTINTTLTSLTATVSSNSSSISTIQSDSTFQSNALGILTTRVNQQADSISAVMNDVDTLGDTVSNFNSSIGSITTLTDNVNGLTSQVSTISSRSFANMQQISTSRNHIEALQPIVASHTTSISSINTSLTDIQSSITSLEDGGSSSAGLQTQIDTLRTDTDANTLSNTQFLNALQYQSTTIFAIDTAIQILNGKVSNLETTQITQDDLIREFDQEFNDPVTGVLFKLDTLTTTYNTHVDGVYLTLRQNVDSNNLILGTLSTQTTSLLTAMTQVNSRVQVLEDNASSSSSTPQFISSTISVSGVSQSTLSAIGPGWTQIKYLSGTSNSWFPGNGNLNGNTGKTEFLFTSGDFSKWLICDISQAIGSFYSDSPRFITKSSISPVEYTATWYNRQSYAPEDPWISLENFFVSAGNGTVMFGENSIVGYQDSIHPSGMYVFVR
jgi:DNA repair ATPase RecN